MALRPYIILSIFILFADLSYSQVRSSNRPVIGDTTTIISRESVEPEPINDMEEVDRFYDSLQSRSQRRGLSRVLHELLFRRQPQDTLAGGVVDRAYYGQELNGLTINSITIQRKPIFDEGSRGIQRYANSMHVLTREATVRRDLLFDVGDRVDMELIVNNEQLIKSRDYVAEADIILQRNTTDTTRVDVIVRTQDRWTISLDGQWRGDRQAKVEIFDANVAGLGDRLSVQTMFKRDFSQYGGNVFSYNTENILGSFFSGRIKFGKDFDERYKEVGVFKNFITRSDYMLGAYYDGNSDEYNLVYEDSTVLIRYNKFDTWAGRSIYLPSARSSIYFAGRYTYADFKSRPLETAPRFNPDFQDYRMALFSTGIYRERFYIANLIHGFGYKEYLAAGYNLEFLGGHRWGEYDDNEWYFGGSFKKGGYTPYGYFMGSARIGSFLDTDNWKWHRGTFNLDARWFSNLVTMGRTQIRQFLTANYTRGFNRDEGFREVLRFTKQNGPLTIKQHDYTGTSRAVINTETVFFTPYKPYGFRLAMYGFLDMGTIGNDPNIFQNSFFSTIGFGVRIKNERLVFRTIQLQFGFTFNKNGFSDNSIRLSNEQRAMQYRYRPQRPEMMEFR